MNLEKIKELLSKYVKNGVPNLVMRDEVTGLPSLTYTLFYLNGLIALGGVVGRFASLVKGVDADAAKELLMVTGTLYVGRAFSKAITKEKKTVKTTAQTKEKTE